MGHLFQMLPVILPIIAGLLIFKLNMNKQMRKTYVVLTTVLNLLLVLLAILQASERSVFFTITQAFIIEFSIDTLAIIFVILVSVIWIIVGYYATEYLAGDSRQTRFYGFFLMTLGCLVGIGFSSNFLTFYLFYELMTFITYPLVNHNGRPEARRAGIQYLIYSLIGAQLTLIAMIGVYYLAGSLSFVPGGILTGTGGESGLVPWLFLAAMIGFGAKAGLFPLHAWLPVAHPVAPAPGSAVLSGLITKAGVLGMIRVIYYVIGPTAIQDTWAHYLMIGFVLISIFIGSTLAYNSKVLKVRLAYSSISQVAYVVLGIMTLNPLGFIGGILHMIFHGIIKNTLFLSTGTMMLMTGVSQVDEIDEIGKHLPITLTTFAIASLGLVGIPPLSGFVSKWYLGNGSLGFSQEGLGTAMMLMIIFSAILTAAYLVPIIVRGLFIRNNQFDEQLGDVERAPELVWPVLILSVGTIAFGLIPSLVTPMLSQLAGTIL